MFKDMFVRNIYEKKEISRNILRNISDGNHLTRWDAGSENLYIWQCIPPKISNQDVQIFPNISESVFRFLLRNVQIFLSDGETRPDAGGENLWHCIRPKI